MATPLLKNSALKTSTAIAAEMMDQIQALVNSAWKIDTNLGGGTLSGSPNDLDYKYTKEYSDSGTIIPGVPAYTVTEEYVIPAVVAPAVPGWGTANLCGPWSKCTTEVPGTPAFTTTPAITVPAVVTPAVPALTGGYSTELDISASVVGISDALEPLFSSITFKSGAMGDPDSDGLASETVTYNLDQSFAGTALQISGRAAFDDLTVDISGADTNFGNVSTGTMKMGDIPNIPIEFDAVVVIPSFNDKSDIINSVNGVSYSLFPQTNDVSVDNLEISTGVTAMADFIDDSLLSYLTDFWNASVVPLYTAVGADAPKAPSQTLADEINDSAASLQQSVNQSGESGVNSILNSSMSTIQPYVQALTAAVWDYSTYPILPGGNYAKAILTDGLFSGVDASGASFKNSDLSNADFSNSNVTGADFTGANLSGTNFSGATGAPSSRKSARSAEATFKDAVLFGADFSNTNFDLSNAYTDDYTKLGENEVDKSKHFNAATFVASSKKLIKQYGLDFEAAKGHFIANLTAKGKSNKPGLRTQVSNGDRSLDSFNHERYISKLPGKIRDKFTRYANRANEDRSLEELAAVHKIVTKTNWDKIDSAEYLFANPDLIERLGGSKKAMRKAKNQYLRNGIFKDNELELGYDEYFEYVQKYPGAVDQTGDTLDSGSLAHHYVTEGHDQGQFF